jgi:transcriptional regulator with XRE-family HTH domain
MDARSEIQNFLTSRRARIAPEQVGLASFGPRRVPGLRREEVAVLAGVSVPYYTRIERGDLKGVSDSVLEAIARALKLDEPSTRTYLTSPARWDRRARGAVAERPGGACGQASITSSTG